MDIFSYPVGFKFNNNDSHRTIFGTFLSLLYASTFCMIVVFFGKDIYERKKPEVVSTTYYDIRPP
jgi:hypothetical protein